MEISYQQIRDLAPASEGAPREPTDVREFFSIGEVSSVRLSGRPTVRDIAVRDGLPGLAVRLQKILTISARSGRSTESIRLPVAPTPSRWSLRRPAVVSTALDLLSPLPGVRANSLDIRALSPLVSIGTYADLYRLPPSLAEVVARALRAGVARAVRASWRIATVALVAAGLLVCTVFFVKTEIEAWYDTLLGIREAHSLSAARDSVVSAHRAFARARTLFAPIAAISGVLPREAALAAHAADGGYALTDALRRLISLADDFRRQGGDSLFVLPTGDDRSDETGFSATAYLSRVEPELRDIRAELSAALASYRAVGSTGDASLDAALTENIDRLATAEGLLGRVLDNYDGLLSALGETKPMRYLVLNQNRDEIRASGGFPGTLFFAELYQGRVRKFEKYDVYDIDWKVAPYREPPPPPLRELTDNFGLRDANYFIDFHETAKKVNFFFEKAGYESLDGVLAINQGIVEELLSVYGPVRIPSLGVEATAENFSTLLSVVTEAKIQPYEQVGKDEFVSPKSFLFEFADELARRLAARADYAGYARIASGQIERGEVLFSSIANSSLDSLAAHVGLDGAWKRRDPAGDWIYPVFTSLSGNKSDRFMERGFTFLTERDPADPARCLHLVTLSSRHTFAAADDAAIRWLLSGLSVPSDRWSELLRIQGSDRNRVHVRFAVPPTARLVDATGDVATDSYGALITYSTIIETRPGETSESRIRYSVPAGEEGACADPELLRQPGLRLR